MRNRKKTFATAAVILIFAIVLSVLPLNIISLSASAVEDIPETSEPAESSDAQFPESEQEEPEEVIPFEVSPPPEESSEPEPDPTPDILVLRLDNPNAWFNGIVTKIDSAGTQPFIFDNRTYVPLRFINEKLGAKVKYDNVGDPIVITKGAKEIRVLLDDSIATCSFQVKGSNKYKMDAPARLFKGKTYVPLRSISELFGYQVKYYSAEALILVSEVPLSAAKMNAVRKDILDNHADILLPKRIPVTGITLNRSSDYIQPKATVQLTEKLSPSNASNTAVRFTTSNKSVATVSSNGLVTGVANGSATITAKTGNGKTAKYAVTVGAPKANSIATSELMQLPKGTTRKIAWSVNPASAASDIAFTTSNSGIATVSGNGTVTAVGDGTCYITIYSKKNGSLRATCIVDVTTNTSKKIIVVYKGSQSIGCYVGEKRTRLAICSTGLPGMETPTGKFSVQFRSGWMYFRNSNCYIKYGLGISGNYVLHTEPYSAQDSSTMTVGGYNLLGSKASHGCVRTCVKDTKWFYENCPVGTPIYICEAYGPRAPKPPAATIHSNGRGWDPTDSDPSSPYNRR